MSMIITLHDFSVRADWVVYAVAPAFTDEDQNKPGSYEDEEIALYSQIGLHDGNEILVELPQKYEKDYPSLNDHSIKEATEIFNQFIKDWQFAVSSMKY